MRKCLIILLFLFSGRAEAQKNIIFIMSDDQSSETIPYMQNLRSYIANEGVTFENFFYDIPLCCPSRVAILTGKSAKNTGIWNNSGSEGGFGVFGPSAHEDSTIAVYLTPTHRTAAFGKYMNGYPEEGDSTYISPGWDDWYITIKNRYNDIHMNENGTVVRSISTYETDYIVEKVVDWIETYKDSSLFAYITVRTPHTDGKNIPAVPANRDSSKFDNYRVPRTPNWNTRGTGKADWYGENLDELTELEIDSINSVWEGQLESLVSVDKMIADIVGALEYYDILDSTTIFYTTDNSYVLGNFQFMPSKNIPYTEVAEFPLFVRGPGIQSGFTYKHLVSNVDLAETWAEIGDVTFTPNSDGTSFLSSAKGLTPYHAYRTAGWLGHHAIGTNPSATNVDSFTSVRTFSSQFIRYFPSGEEELYDILNDPYSLTNDSTNNPIYINEIDTVRQSLDDCIGQDCIYKEIFFDFGVQLSNTDSSQLDWSTPTLNLKGFGVERSTDDVVFDKISFVQRNPELGMYQFIDPDLASDTYYYRVRDIETDSTTSSISVVIP